MLMKLPACAGTSCVPTTKRTAERPLLFGVLQSLLLMHTAEESYPGYSVSQNFISDLGVTCRDSACSIVQPSSTIFNSSIMVPGLTLMASSYLLYRQYSYGLFPGFLSIAGIGTVCVGLFPVSAGSVHLIVSAITFLFGGLATIASYRIVKSVLSYFSISLGLMTLVALIFYKSRLYLGLGAGGMERMIAFPVLFWCLSLVER
ncbi:MAG: DUF998 domain-containing protein [Nitrososphaerales archaeon]